jgi:hypothetical protein
VLLYGCGLSKSEDLQHAHNTEGDTIKALQLEGRVCMVSLRSGLRF